MKSYWKGFLSGAAVLSVLLGGTFVYAAGGTTIEVFFNNIKIMVDGTEKKPEEGKPFIYEGSTYVPLRFISDALGKEVGWNEQTQTVWIGKQEENILAQSKEAQNWLKKSIDQTSKLQSLSLQIKANTLGGKDDGFQIGVSSSIKADVILQPSLTLKGENEQTLFGVPFPEQFYYTNGTMYSKFKIWEASRKSLTDMIPEQIYDPSKLLELMLAASADARMNTSNEGIEVQIGGSGEKWGPMARLFLTEKDLAGEVAFHELKMSLVLDKETALPKTLNVALKITTTEVEDDESWDVNTSISIQYDQYNGHKELMAPADLKLQPEMK
jgi:hypothetical protein